MLDSSDGAFFPSKRRDHPRFYINTPYCIYEYDAIVHEADVHHHIYDPIQQKSEDIFLLERILTQPPLWNVVASRAVVQRETLLGPEQVGEIGPVRNQIAGSASGSRQSSYHW